MNPGRIVMHQYLVGKGMHPQDAEHVVINSGAGIVDWFKKHKGKILGALGTVGALAAATAIKNYQQNKRGEENQALYKRALDEAHVRDSRGYGFFDTLKDIGNDAIKRYGPQIVKKYLPKPMKPKPKKMSKQALHKEFVRENNNLMKGVPPLFKKQMLKYRREAVGEGVIRKLIDKVLEGDDEEIVIEDFENKGLEGLGIIDWFKKHKDNLYAIGKAGYDLYK